MGNKMRILPYQHLDKKGLGAMDLFNAIPVGKKGTSRTYSLPNGTLTTNFHANIRDAEIKVAVTLLSHTFNQLGIESVQQLREGKTLPVINEETGQTLYTNGISIDAKELSELTHKGDRTKGRRVFKNLQHLEDLVLRYDLDDVNCTIKMFDNIAYKNGIITFNIANMLLNRLGTTLITFRLPPILEHNGLTMRLSMYIESHQRPGRQYKDSSGEKRTKFYPKNEYYLDDLKLALNVMNRREDKVISELQNAFDELHNGMHNPLSKFTYNKFRRSFENEFKNGKK